MAKRWRNDAEKHAFFLSKKVDKAIRHHNMIEEGDRILVGVSGGKDSVSLLRLLVYRATFSPVKYELVAAHIRGDARGSEIEVPDNFIKWLEDEGVPFVIQDMTIPETEELPMGCERCARNRRRTLFEVADAQGCNKVALGHNVEDFSHTALLNLFYHGRLETMAFRRNYFGGRFAVIRPLAYVREREIIGFAKACEFPIVPNECPEAPFSKRQTAKEMMHKLGRDFRYANINIIRAACRNDVDFGEEVI